MKISLMILVSILSIGLVSFSLGFNLQNIAKVTAVFVLCNLAGHYFFIWFPKALNKTVSLQLAVKIIYDAVDEAIVEPKLKATLKTKLNQAFKKLSAVLDQNLFIISNFNLLKIIRKTCLDEAWRRFFIEAFQLIEKEVEDRTIQQWTMNKIKHKLNEDECARIVKVTLQPFLKDSKYYYLVEQ